MSYQKLQHASELYMKLNEVNEQIEGLEKVAMQVIDGGPEVSLSLSILSPKGFETPEPDEIDDYYKSIPAQIRHAINSGNGPYFISGGSSEPINKPTTFYQSLSDVVTLQILNMLMYEKKQIKKGLIDRIKELNLV